MLESLFYRKNQTLSLLFLRFFHHNDAGEADDAGGAMADIHGGFWTRHNAGYQPILRVFPPYFVIAVPQSGPYGGILYRRLELSSTIDSTT